MKKERDAVKKERDALKEEMNEVKRERDDGWWDIDTLESEIRILKLKIDFE